MKAIQKTFSAKTNEVKREWFLLDASDQILGRLASKVATILRGKHKAIYTPNADTGDYIVIINAEKIRVTGNKFNDKIYHHHTGYVGNLKSIAFKDLQAKKPELIIQKAVKGMLPKGALGSQIVSKMKVFAGQKHDHTAQQPQILTI